MAQPLLQIADALDTQQNSTVDLQNYRAGGLEVIKLCGGKLF